MKKLLYSILALTLFALACKKDDGPKTGQIDKAKVNTLLKQMGSYENFVSIPGFSSNVMSGKAVKNHVFDGESFGPIGGVTPIIKQTTDGTINYEYDFDNPAAPSSDYDGKLTIKVSATGTIPTIETIYVNFKDNTLKDAQGKPMANLINGNFKISGGLDGVMVMNSDLTIAVAGQPTFTTKFKDFSIKETSTGSESNGIMEFITGNETYTYVFTKVIDNSGCELLPVSGKLKITAPNPAEVLNIDFGNGTCDKKVTVTYNGATEEITLD